MTMFILLNDCGQKLLMPVKKAASGDYLLKAYRRRGSKFSKSKGARIKVPKVKREKKAKSSGNNFRRRRAKAIGSNHFVKKYYRLNFLVQRRLQREKKTRSKRLVGNLKFQKKANVRRRWRPSPKGFK